MIYSIHTNDAEGLRNKIISCVKEKKDPRGKDIHSWDVTNTEKKEIVLVHVTDQWEKKGCISLITNKEHDLLIAKFKYWKSFKEKDRAGDEDKYLYGRFTELLLVHFYEGWVKVEIA